MISALRSLARRWAAAACLACLALPAAAQGLFDPVATVNDRAVTGYELQQRIRMLEVFNTPGDLRETALEQLIEDRLKAEELARRGLEISDESLRTAMEEFAGRANLSLDQFLARLSGAGVEEETFRDFVKVGTSWRDYIRLRYGDRITITEADIDRAIAQSGRASSGVEVLLSEIILPARPNREGEVAEAEANAARISQMRSTGAFSAAASELSALPSRDQGGRLPWQAITEYPAPIQQILLDLSPGEVTRPIPVQNGIALFQLRDLREVLQPAPAPASIDYAMFYIAGGRSEAALQEAASVAARVDTCDDLFGVAQGLPPERLERVEQAPGQIPTDIALELAKLDAGEHSLALTRNDGQTLVFLMLCGRTPAGAEETDREAVRRQIQNARLQGYADGLVADLRAAATITGG